MLAASTKIQRYIGRAVFAVIAAIALAAPLPAWSDPAPVSIEDQLNIWEKRMVQEGLILLGQYNGFADGDFGKGTRAAIAAFQSHAGRPATGQISAADALDLADAAISLRKTLGWQPLDTLSGSQMSYPANLLTNRQKNDIGGEDLDSKDGHISLETLHLTGVAPDFISTEFDKGLNRDGDRVTYKARWANSFILSGERQNGKFYIRIEQRGSEARGFDLTWNGQDDTLMQRLSVLLSNDFYPFGDPRAEGQPSYPTLLRLIQQTQQNAPQSDRQAGQKPSAQDEDSDDGNAGVIEYKEGSEPFPKNGALITPEGRGLRFTYQYVPPKNPDFRYAFEWVTDEHLFRNIPEIDGLDGLMVLPHPLRYVTAECGTVNAFYSKKMSAVVLCYEMVDSLLHMGQALSKGAKDPKALTIEFVRDNIRFILLHESGHALIDMLDLPAVGREEDSVDQLAAVMLRLHVDHDENENNIIRVMQLAATWFKVNGAQQADNSDMRVFADEHALDAQRYFNLLCMIYGSNPDEFQDLVSDGMLPEERADRCPDESAKITRSWSRLLLPHFAPRYQPKDQASGGGGNGQQPDRGGNPLEWDGKSNPLKR